MNGTVRRILKTAGILTLLCAFPAWSAVETDGFGPGWETPKEQKTDAGFPENSETAEETKGAGQEDAELPAWMTAETEHVVVVSADKGGSSRATVSYYKKKDGWEEIFSVRGVVGKGGVVSPEDKKEGDKKTPAGAYDFIRAFGIRENPGSVLEYHKIRQGDVWVDDSSSAHYNRMVNASETAKDWSSAENLAAMSPWYDYCLALSYNEEQTPGKGSAIFLHCLREGDWGTSGCIAIPENEMKILLKNLNVNSKIFIKSEK